MVTLFSVINMLLILAILAFFPQAQAERIFMFLRNDI